MCTFWKKPTDLPGCGLQPCCFTSDETRGALSGSGARLLGWKGPVPELGCWEHPPPWPQSGRPGLHVQRGWLRAQGSHVGGRARARWRCCEMKPRGTWWQGPPESPGSALHQVCVYGPKMGTQEQMQRTGQGPNSDPLVARAASLYLPRHGHLHPAGGAGRPPAKYCSPSSKVREVLEGLHLLRWGSIT